MAHVLLIEDDESQRFIASFALRKAGHEVREAPDGAHGLAVARSTPPEVIVCDVMMPGMSGYEVVTALRADPELAQVPVILLTAMSERQHMRQGMTSGADDYLTKPYRPEELCDAIAAALQRRQAQKDAMLNSMSDMVETALEQQKETLGRQYESQLQREIDARWARANAATDLRYEQAFVLLADLVRPAPGEDEAALAERVKQAQQGARDTLYLFGAAHVLPYGSKVLALFPADQGSLTTPAELRALRAAVALVKAAGRDRPVTLALHAGAVALVAVHDGLHGDQGHTLVPGEALHVTAALEELAAREDWRIASSQALAGLLGERASLGRSATTARGDAAVEVLGLGAG